MSWVAMTTAVPDLFSSMNSRSSRCAKRRIDVAGRLVGEQELRPRDHRARDRRALLLAAGQHRRQRIHAVAEADPVQQFDDLAAIARSPRGPSRGTAARRSRRWSCGRAGGNPGTRCRCAGAGRRAHPCSSGETSWPNMLIRPRVGRSDRNSSRSSEVLPAPDGPVRNWNECGSMWKLRSRRTSGPSP